jgi:hypothetical protein
MTRKPARSRRNPKPSGYWNDIANLEHELRAFIKEHGRRG